MTPPDRQFSLLLPGKIPPHQSHSETSREAAERILPNVGTLRYRVLAFIQSRGLYGATDEEIQHGLNIGGNTVRPRRRELEKGRLVVNSRRTRRTISKRNAVVWVVSDPTQETLM